MSPFLRGRGVQGWRRLCNLTTIIPALLSLTVIWFIASMMSDTPGASYLKYTTITEFFLQDEASTDADNFDYEATDFGLKERRYDTDREFDPELQKTQWQRFEYKVKTLNDKSQRWEQFKVLFLGRHGQGTHNVAETFYGREAWDCYWAAQDGNETSSWVDAHLTKTGIEQAEAAHSFWKKQLEVQKMPAPETYYVSPLDRCLNTANITFGELNLPTGRPFVPTVKELLREANGIHTCDRRSTRSYIRNQFPGFEIEPGFSERDELWSPTVRETNSALDARLRTFLDDIFTHDRSTFVSFTSHSGAIASILRVLGHRKFRLQTGGAIPVIVKAEAVRGEPPQTTIIPPTPAASCTSTPTTQTPNPKIPN